MGPYSLLLNKLHVSADQFPLQIKGLVSTIDLLKQHGIQLFCFVPVLAGTANISHK